MTFGVIKDRIARDLDRHLAELHGDEIGQAVKDAIEFYSHERFWFLEGENTSLTTVANTAAYAKPSNVLEIDEIGLTVGTSIYRLDQESWGWYRERDVTPSGNGSQPGKYIVYQDKIYLYPTPTAAWQVTIWGLMQLPALSADSDTNAWVTPPAAELIRAHAKADLYAGRLHQPDLAIGQMNIADLWLRRLRERTVSEVATGRVTPTQF